MSNTRFVKPIAILSGVLIAISIGLGGLWLFGNYVLDAGKEDSAWLENMWGASILDVVLAAWILMSWISSRV